MLRASETTMIVTSVAVGMASGAVCAKRVSMC